MEELYSETYLKAKPTVKRMMARISMFALLAFVVLVCIYGLLSLNMVLCLVLIVVGAIIILVMPTTNVAYEYIFVDGQIDFDRILKGEKRKTMKRIDMEKIDIIAPENSDHVSYHKNLPLVDYSSGLDTDRHFIAVASGDKGTERIRFTPDEKMIRMMKMKGPSKVKES